MKDILKLARVQLVVLVIFVFAKLIRPFVLKNFPTKWGDIILLSLPNFFEAIIGVVVLTSIGLVVNQRWLKNDYKLNNKTIYFVATVIAAIYVISQELKFHNLGGENVYDPFDVLFSMIGLVSAYFIVLYIKPKV